MSDMPDDINQQINAGRKTIAMAREEPEDELEPRRVPPAVIAAGVGAAVVGLGLIAWLIYRSRRRRTLVEQLQASMPDRISQLRELGVGRLSDVRDAGAGRWSDLRDLSGELRDQIRERIKKAI